MTQVRVDVDGLVELRSWYQATRSELLETAVELGRIQRQLGLEMRHRAIEGAQNNPRFSLTRHQKFAYDSIQLLDQAIKALFFTVSPACTALVGDVDNQLRALEEADRPSYSNPLDLQVSTLKTLLVAPGLGLLVNLMGAWIAGRLGYQGPAYARPIPAPLAALSAHPTVAELLTRVSKLGNSEVEVIKVLNQQGLPRYIVLIRGIAELAGGPNSLIDAIRGSKFGSSAHSAGVLSAMRAAKIPRGAEVMLVGHSQGGITARNLAADKNVNSLDGEAGYVRITHVITAGSPTAGKHIPTGTRVLALENDGDVIPDLDGEDARSGRGQYVHRFGNLGTLDLAGAHELSSSYIPEARRKQFTDDPGVRRFVSSAGSYLDYASQPPERFLLKRGVEQAP